MKFKYPIYTLWSRTVELINYGIRFIMRFTIYVIMTSRHTSYFSGELYLRGKKLEHLIEILSPLANSGAPTHYS